MARRSQTSAGILAYRRNPGLEVLLVHPGGPYWAKRDAGSWSIPKGVVEQEADLEDTARREFREETGFVATAALKPLPPVRQKSGKLVHAFATSGDFPLTEFHSNTFEMEWPPRSGRMARFPEADRAAYFDLPTAHNKIIAYQAPFLTDLQNLLDQHESEEPGEAHDRLLPGVVG